MWSKVVSMQVKEAIIRQKTPQNKPIRHIAETLQVAKSTIWYILKKKECTGELSNTKRPGRPQKTTKVDDRRIIFLVKKNPFTTSSQVKNRLEEVGTVYHCQSLYECKYRGLQTTGNTQEQKGQVRLCWNKTLWTDETKINVYQNEEKNM